MKTSSFPPIIAAVADFLAKKLPLDLEQACWEQSNRMRSMRFSYKAQIQKILQFLIQHFDIHSGLLIRRIKDKIYIPITLEFVAQKCACSVRTISRIFSFLAQAGVLHVQPQRQQKLPRADGSFTLICHACARKLTNAFFAMFGLLALLQSNRQGKAPDNIVIRQTGIRKAWKGPKRAVPAPLPVSPPPQRRPGGLESIGDMFRRAAAQGVPLPSHLLAKP